MSGRIVRSLVLALGCASLTFAAGAAAPADTGADSHMLGFTASGATQELNLEQRFDKQLSASEMRDWLKRLSSQPNQVGSPHDKANAEWVLAQFKKWGWDAHIEKFDVLYPTPKHELVELIAPSHFKAKLHEPPIKGDRTSALPGALPPYNVYSPDGDVTGELVYVNYGMPDDYKQLARMGVSVKGKIVIVRYGGGWRGLKPRLAYEHGAIGCLIYSDPRDDGYFVGDTYPKGSMRPADGVQRGSVEAQPLNYPGDPSTPGYGSVAGAKHLPLDKIKDLQKIPVLPISYADATPLLKAMGGPVAPEKWRGALPFTYHVGGGPAKVHMVVKSDWGLKTIYDVIAKLPGSSDADQWVLRGNHRDGWVFGADDPLAGTVAQLGEAKALGALYKQGWRPKRTIVYASWDAEEPGLLGSTEWVETHAKELQRKAVLYLNTDGNGRGFLHAGGSPSLQHLVNQIAAGVTDPETGVSVQRRLRARLMVEGNRPGASARSKALAKLAGQGKDLWISPLGSGSDFGTFLDRLGIAVLSVGFGGENKGGVYHSRYDSFDHFIRFGDPTFEYEVALAKVVGHVMLRSANAKVLPMRFGDFSAALDRYVAKLHKDVDAERKSVKQQHELLDSGAYKLASDPMHPLAPPARLSEVPNIDFSMLDTAASKLKKSAQAFETAYAARATAGLDIPASRLTQINQLMGTLAQRLANDRGLPGRTWYRNEIYAPGILKGYGVAIFPAIRQELVARKWTAAQSNAAVIAATLDGYRKQLDQLTVLLKR
ncbi:MAG: M20/M25/M40 family metallo-hydrolase [Rhodanobacteraceae bacterium]